MGRKWLDNYGQEDNYNDSKVSLSKGFVGQGYDISRRNYSPAWGGQFQSGGNVESKWEYSNTNGKLIPQSQLKASELGYLKDWLSSPMAKKIALKREGESGLNNLDTRLERLNDSNLEISTAEELLKSTNSYTRRRGEKFNNKDLQGTSYTNPSTKYGNIVTRRMAPENVILHEGAHQSTSGNNLLLKNDIEDILSRVRDDSGSYLSNPTEVHVRLNVLRKELKNSGVVDPFKTPVSKEHLNKFLNNYKKPGEVSDKPLIEANSGELLNILNSQDDAVWLLNNIVSNQNNNLIPIAENGKVIKDNDGYWNPDNWGKVVEIDSNNITMKGVHQPLLGISDEGDMQYMEPNKDYKFKGKKVREFPIARNGINNLDENSLQQLDQLTNFTNYNKLSTGGWLDKF